MTLLLFLIILGALVFVHELGHFISAKRAGIRVDEFALGFPPRLFSVKKGETAYTLNLIPFGGYVKIFGDDADVMSDAAVSEEDSKVQALELGADDYVTKPFNVKELTARIRAALRRAAGATSAAPVFTTGDLAVNFDRREVRFAGKPVKLTATEYNLLKYMIEHAGKVLTHRMLLSAVWGPAYAERTEYLRVFIGQLRKKLEHDPMQPRLIVTDMRVGYRLCTDADQEYST